MKTLPIIFIVLFSFSSYIVCQELCVADTSTPEGPEGFNCKNPENITVDDFVFRGPGAPKKSSSIAKYVVTYATLDEVPGLNGLGLSLARANVEVGGFIPMHTHTGSSEYIVVTSGEINITFISPTNNVYSANLKTGDAIVIPQGVLHFYTNSGNSPVVAYGFFTGERISTQSLEFALYANELPSDLLAKVTFLDVEQINKLKALFGGTN
ncbi:Germin-like protein 1 [Euphorbia peplus]|nr:Germin-like protein 1 [Euphorbia peplus]